MQSRYLDTVSDAGVSKQNEPHRRGLRFFFFFLFGATGGRWRTGTTLDRRGRVNTRRCGPNDRRRPSFGEYQRGRGLERIVSIA